MDIMTCPHCHQKTNRPVFLPRAQQQIFDFVWNNPWCSVEDIRRGLYGASYIGSENLIAVQLSKIATHLLSTTFTIAKRNAPYNHKTGGTPRQYRIEEVPNVPF